MPSKRVHEFIYWTDLETTGSDLDGNQILEIGAVITDMQLRPIQAREYVLPMTMKVEMKPVVVQMHTKNGLFEDARESKWTLAEVDEELEEWIRSFNGSNHMAFAGSGVGHFDRQFYARDLPLTTARLTYWPLDVGVVRRFFTMLAGTDWLNDDNVSDPKSHRALADVYYHISEARYAVDIIRNGGIMAASTEMVSEGGPPNVQGTTESA